jgi:hypothetical protein
VIPSARREELVGHVNGHWPLAGIDTTESVAFTRNVVTYYLGPSYAIGLGDDFRVGATLFTAYTRQVVNANFRDITSAMNGSQTFRNSIETAYEDNSAALVPVLGLQWQVVPKLWLGLAGSPPSIHLGGKRTATTQQSGVSPDPLTGASVAVQVDSNAEAYSRYQLPWRINAGIAYDDRQTFSAAADVSYYGAGPLSRLHGTERATAARSGDVPRSYVLPFRDSGAHRDSVLDVAAGIEWPFHSLLALRAGGFIDRTFVPSIRDTDLFVTRLDHYGGTLGLGIQLGSFDTTLGGVFVYGTGQFGADNSWGAVSGEPLVLPVNLREYTAMFVMSGAVTTEEAKETIRKTLPFDFKPPELPGAAPAAPPAPAGSVAAPPPPAAAPPPPPAPAPATPLAPAPPESPTPEPAPAAEPGSGAPAPPPTTEPTP